MITFFLSTACGCIDDFDYCENGGTCYCEDGVSDKICHCTPQYTGDKCEDPGTYEQCVCAGHESYDLSTIVCTVNFMCIYMFHVVTVC